ncbi:MAG: PD-(D/E)XK nuclease family protein [Bdellovibrionaceae bacterium]|nr:PD-(D/E)XK nuclease family protein [Pseudobdellovibrionaceae bacterium]
MKDSETHNHTKTPQPEATLLVESTELALSISYLVQKEAANLAVLSVEALTGYGPPSLSERARRLQLFTSWLPNTERNKAHQYLRTVEDLRGAFLTSHEDIEFCFSELPETPKNVFLRSGAHSYLDSPLKEDRAEALWQLIERIKTDTLEKPLPQNLLALTTPEASYGYKELLALLSSAPGVAEFNAISPTEFFHWQCEKGDKRPLQVAGGVSALLETLARHLGKSKSALSFSGTPVQASYLRFALARRGIAADFVAPKEDALPDYSSDHITLQMIRQDRGRPLKERLELSRALLREKPSKKRTIALEPAPRKALDVALLPYFPYPGVFASSLCYFIDGQQAATTTRHPLLDRHEVHLLKSAGFSIPTQEDAILSQTQTTTLLSEHGQHRNRIFTTTYLAAGRRIPTAGKTEKPKAAPSYRVPFEAKRFSASQLESYARCPAQYLLANRLRLDEGTGDFESEFALLLGSAIHSALEIYKKEKLEGEAALFESLEKTLSTEQFNRLSVSERFLLRETAVPYFKQFLNNEAALRETFQSTRPLMLEQTFDVEIGGVTLRGKIDRVDETENGQLLVMDYKTGNVTFSPNHIAAGTNYQALVYLLGAEAHFKAPIAGVLFNDLKKGELRRGILRAEAVRPEAAKSMTRGHTLVEEKLQALLESGTEKLKEQVEHLSAGDFSPLPDPQHCASCRLYGHCRQGAGYV